MRISDWSSDVCSSDLPKRCPGLEPLDDTDQFFDMGCLEPGERGEKRADPVAEPGSRAARPGLLNPEPEKAPPRRRVEPGVGDHDHPSLDGRKQARRRETRIETVVAARADVLVLPRAVCEKTQEHFVDVPPCLHQLQPSLL